MERVCVSGAGGLPRRVLPWHSAAVDFAQHALALKHGPRSGWGWSRQLQDAAGYRSPDAFYEGQLLALVHDNCRWLDLGCGRSPCPFNPRLAELLSRRAAVLVGVDPSPNLWRNPYLHDRIQSSIEAFSPPAPFDLVTLRMVAEHLADPARVSQALRRLVRPGGTVVIYTVHRWAPTAVLGRLSPHRAHRLAMRVLFGGEARDVFPAYYQMNTPAVLARLLGAAGLRMSGLRLLDDCRATQRFRRAHVAELRLWRLFRRLGAAYPERCLLATFTG